MKFVASLIFAVTILMPISVMAKTVEHFVPFPECPKLILKAKKIRKHKEDVYRVYYASIPGKRIDEVFPVLIPNLDDRTSLVPLLEDLSPYYCPGISITETESGAYCIDPSDTEPSLPEIINHLNIDMAKYQKDCKRITEVIKLQNQIAELDPQTDLVFHKKESVFDKFYKSFTSKETQNIMHLFNICGGKKNSSEFLKNYILMEASNQCLIPQYMEWDAAAKLAETFSKRYESKSILSLGIKSNKIQNEVIVAFSEEIMAGYVAPLFNNDSVKTHNFLNELKTFQSFKRRVEEGNTRRLFDHLSYIFAVEVPFELTEKSMPHLIGEQLGGKFPENMNPTEKANIINNKLLPIAMGSLNKCLIGPKYKAGIKEYFDYHKKKKGNKKEKHLIKKRKKKEQRYCEQFPENCNSDLKCGGNSNIISESKDASDIDIVVGCIYSALLEVFPKFTSELLDSYSDTLEGLIKWNTPTRDFLVKKGLSDFEVCMNKDSDVSLVTLIGDRFIPNKKALELISIKDFENKVLGCGEEVEAGLVKEVVKLVILDREELKPIFPLKEGGETSKILGTEYPEELVKYSDAFVVDYVQPCLDHQDKITSNPIDGYALAEKDPMMCTPLAEMMLTHKVLEFEVDEMMKKEQKQRIAEYLELKSQYKQCTDGAYQDVLKSIGHTKDFEGLNSKNASDYLNIHHGFRDCTQKYLVDLAGFYAGYEAGVLLVENKDSLHYFEEHKKLIPEIREMAKQCFSRRISEEKTWADLSEYLLDEDLLIRLSDECTNKIVIAQMPRVTEMETMALINQIKDEHFFGVEDSDEQIDLVLENSMSNLADRYGFSLVYEQDGKLDFTETLRNATTQYLKEDKAENLENFLKVYEYSLTREVIAQIYGNFEQKASGSPYVKQRFDDFKEALPSSCVHRVWNKYKDHLDTKIKILNEETDKAREELKKNPSYHKPKHVPLFSDFNKMLTNGLVYLKQLGTLRYEAKLKEIKAFCVEVNKYETIDDFVEKNPFDFILKARIRDEVKKALYDAQRAQRVKILKKHAGKPYSQQRKMFLDYTDSKIHELITKYIDNPTYFEKYIYNDGTVINMIQKNFWDILVPHSDAQLETINFLLKRLFKRRGNNTPASDFVKAQVINGIGTGGIDSAAEKIVDAVLEINTVYVDLENYVDEEKDVDKIVIEELLKVWTPAEIERLMEWESINEESRSKLIQVVYDKSILPKLNLASLRETRENDIDVDNYIKAHLSVYDYSNGEKKKPDTFNRRVEQKILMKALPRVASEAIKEFKQDVKEVVDDVVDGIKSLF